MDNIEKSKKDKDLTLTMQQKFNFDSNEFDEENTKNYKKIKNINSSSKLHERIKEVVKIKNMYKRKYRIFLSLFIIMIFICFGMIVVYFNMEPKIEKKIIEKEVVPENIVFLGDSITEFYNLEEHYGSEINFVNSGINGNTTDDILNNMENRVYVFNPSKVFILIGTNDITENKTKKEIVDNIKKIINEIQKNRPYCKIYIESIYPINNIEDEKIDSNMVKNRTNEYIKEINVEIKKIAIENNTTYIDMYSILEDKKGNLKLEYTKEGLHISENGYKIITEKLKEYIK